MKAIRSGDYSSLSGILISGCILIMLFSSFTNSQNLWNRSNADDLNKGLNTSMPDTVASILLPYFPKIYSGLGTEHMNINLVSLKLTGLNTGDEIGVFDGIYCVGSIVITENHMFENRISIPASANDSLITSPNGYIQGHKITLKVYRTGKEILLYFQCVNNSQDIFEKRGSMFALVDFSRSNGQPAIDDLKEIKSYQNPLTIPLKIEINVPKEKNISVAIFDINGILIQTLFEGITEGQLQTYWDGKDNNKLQVLSGVYFCLVNQTIYGIIYQGIELN